MRIGVDITHTSRFSKIVSKHGERFVKKVLSDDELVFWRISATPDRFLASRWAAKEALTKAMGSKLPFQGVQIDSNGAQPPSFQACSEQWKRVLPAGTCLSISHDLDIAVAMVVVPVAVTKT
jgi:holo-[acyl-carrier protein] synthase